MKITEKKNGIFVLETKNYQYVLGAGELGVYHLHWGSPCPQEDFEITELEEQNSNHAALDFIPTEYAPFGGTIYRECALKCMFADGCRDTVLKYEKSNITDDTLEIYLRDDKYGLSVSLVYRLFEENDIIERYTVIRNQSEDKIILEKAASAEINLPGQRAYTIINSNGSWGGEFQKSEQTLENGTLSFESRKGTTGHHHLPALIAAQKPDEENGEVYFAVLEWDGNFKISAERDFTGRTSAVIGLNDFDFSQTIESGEEFRTPSVFCGIARGLGNMSRMMNRFAVRHILPENFANESLPVLYNSWEATEFNVSEKGQLELAKTAAEIGCELFVMDDGWFSTRLSDKAGLGDWEVNRDKFPNGLKPLIDGVNALGMDFGIWVEPEMVNPRSELYEKHPDWTYNYKTRTPSLLRHQLVLNMTKPEVKEYVFGFLDKLLSENNIKYIKWDMNRPFSETGADNLKDSKELWYRHSEAVFDIVDCLKEKHKDVQFEACASGGGRTDLGSLSHFDMVWPSDNTDPVDRLDIQQGYSLLYPIKCMRAWVTDTNKKARPVSMAFRFAVSMQGALSVGADLTRLSKEEIEDCKKYIALYKKIRRTVQFGDLYRIMNYAEDKIYFNGYVNDDKSQAVYFACTGANSFFGNRFVNLKFKGLDGNAVYTAKSEFRSFKKSGAYLMNKGIDVIYYKPLESEIFLLEKE